jgi:hypothetical protein
LAALDDAQKEFCFGLAAAGIVNKQFHSQFAIISKAHRGIVG